jgi:hypothetical protein
VAKKRHIADKSKQGSRRKLLFISYFFPPTAGGGVFRPLAMVKYLSRLGWDITVITSTTPKHYPVDPDLEKQIPSDVNIIRIPVVWEGSYFRRILGKLNLEFIPKALITPDERIFWAAKAESKARKLIKEDHYDCLYTTGPPHSILLSGLWLKRATKISWIAEFRDPWTLAPYLSSSNPHQKRFADDAESDLMEKADAVVMVTPSFAKMMQAKYPTYASKVHCVENGFDADDFKGAVSTGPSNKEFTIVAAGTVFGRYNMNDFLDGLANLKKSDASIYQKLRVNFQGLPDYKLNMRLLEGGLNDRCRSRGFVAHKDNIADLVGADLLILPLSEVPNGRGHMPSRVYEFLASGAPILAICPDGDLADLVCGFPHVTRIYPGDTSGVSTALKDAIARWENGTSLRGPGRESFGSFTREYRAKEINAIMMKIVSDSVGGK